MKFKYKKLIMIVCTFIMGIGMIVFSTESNSNRPVSGKEKGTGNFSEYILRTVNLVSSDALKAADGLTATPTQLPERDKISEAVAANVLEKDAYQDINKLITEYYNAKISKKADNFKLLVNDVNLLDMEDIERQNKYIEAYENVSCYTRKGMEEGSFIVYAYHERKISGIDTLAPGMDRFYVKTNDNGKPYIYFGEVDKDNELYLKASDESEEVLELIYNVNQKYDKAASDDETLSEFRQKLEESVQSIQMND